MQTLREAKEYTIKMLSEHWVQWIHSGTKPAITSAEKDLNTAIGAMSSHCAKCLNLNGCCFVKDKCPSKPLHPKCHCYTIDIPSPTAYAQCPIEKIRDYIFSDSKNKGKKYMFESWGYSTLDSEKIKNEIERQATISYSVGDYKLGKLNEYGQRISITITLKRVNENDYVSFLTGWMVYPDGRIVLVTPYGGK